MRTLRRQWQHRLELKDVIDIDLEDVTPDVTAASAKTIHERLEQFRFANYPDDSDLEEISDQFHTIAFIDGPAGVADMQEFNAILNELYDWADIDKRLWID